MKIKIQFNSSNAHLITRQYTFIRYTYPREMLANTALEKIDKSILLIIFILNLDIMLQKISIWHLAVHIN